MGLVMTGVYQEDLKSKLGYLKTVWNKPASSQALFKFLLKARPKVISFHLKDKVPDDQGGLGMQMLNWQHICSNTAQLGVKSLCDCKIIEKGGN